MITCARCKDTKPDEEFRKRAGRKRSHDSYCIPCRNEYNREWSAEHAEDRAASRRAAYPERREQEIARAAAWQQANPDRRFDSHLRRKYGITLTEYEAMRGAQDDRCAICRRPEQAVDPRSGKRRRLHVDHDHGTNRVRGLLCTRCNIAVGYLLDDHERATALAAYLVEHGEVIVCESS